MTADPARTAICDYPGCEARQFIEKYVNAVAELTKAGWRVWRDEGPWASPSCYCPQHRATPPEGWLQWGSHAALERVPDGLEFSREAGEDGFPLWERHEGCSCTFPEEV